jgi:K+-transporting ATPase ATPase A chain
MWTLPVLLLAAAIIVSIPLSRYFAWIMDGRDRAPAWLGRI